ncbi:hypothetical protein [Saccharomonospora iraqiensis]|uniref:hypothetical protein n=1 Tax=Saccharomonospora iraqiensis TaxID=52698 RepID=UPI0012B615B0|nr:hypothetical protein [Saccharomonospora iraqiensis]
MEFDAFGGPWRGVPLTAVEEAALTSPAGLPLSGHDLGDLARCVSQTIDALVVGSDSDRAFTALIDQRGHGLIREIRTILDKVANQLMGSGYLDIDLGELEPLGVVVEVHDSTSVILGISDDAGERESLDLQFRRLAAETSSEQ